MSGAAAFGNIFKIPELKKRVLFTLGILIVYRIGAHIPTPGINSAALAELFEQARGTILGFFDMFSGGALSRLTIFALGIMPYTPRPTSWCRRMPIPSPARRPTNPLPSACTQRLKPRCDRYVWLVFERGQYRQIVRTWSKSGKVLVEWRPRRRQIGNIEEGGPRVPQRARRTAGKGP